MKKMYTSKAVPTTIAASTSTTVKLGDNYFKVEAHEERKIPDGEEVDMDREWDFLFDEINSVCDAQVEEIIKNFRATKNRA